MLGCRSARLRCQYYCVLKSGAQIFAALQVAGKSGAVFRGRVAQLRQRDPRLAAYLTTTRPLSRALAALTDMGDQEVGQE